MKKVTLLVTTIAVALLLFVCIVGIAAVPASATCWICGGGGGGGYPTCMEVCEGAGICATYSDPPYCQTIDEDCCEGCGCQICGEGCCAKGKDGKNGKCDLKKIAFQLPDDKPSLPQAGEYHDHTQEFLADLERGRYDKVTGFYISADNPIIKSIMNMPVSHWKSFQQRVVLQGAQKDPHFDPKFQKPGMPQQFIDLETRSGHKLTIHLVPGVRDRQTKTSQSSKKTAPKL